MTDDEIKALNDRDLFAELGLAVHQHAALAGAANEKQAYMVKLNEEASRRAAQRVVQHDAPPPDPPPAVFFPPAAPEGLHDPEDEAQVDPPSPSDNSESAETVSDAPPTQPIGSVTDVPWRGASDGV